MIKSPMNLGKISRFRVLEEEDPEVSKSELHVYTRRVDKSLSNILKKRRERLEFSFRLHAKSRQISFQYLGEEERKTRIQFPSTRDD
jgi:hypothetical protein